MSKWIAEFELEDGDKMPEHMDLEYHGVKIDFHCRPIGKTYEDGLNEAWKAARKMYQFNPINNKQLCEELYDMGFNEFICSTTASEAIEAIEKYEGIKVGDEVVDKYGWKRVVTKTHNSGEITIMDCNGQFYECCKKAVESDLKKTGRNFPQIEEVLKRMQEGNE